MQTWLDNVSPRGAILTLAALLLAIVASAFAPSHSLNIVERPTVTTNVDAKKAASISDAKLYQNIIARVAKNENYYAAAASEQRSSGYPLKPFITVRSPLLAWFSAMAGPDVSQMLLKLLIVSTAILLALQLRRSIGVRNLTPLAIAYVSILPLLTFLLADLSIWHELWASLLIACGLVAYKAKRTLFAAALFLLAALVRDLAGLAMLAMLAAAILERKWSEAKLWGGALACFAAFLVWHAHQVGLVVIPGDKASAGWNGMGGWPVLVAMVRTTGPLLLLPSMAASIMISLALFGWAAIRDETWSRAGLIIGGYSLLIMLFARDANLYWAFFVTPLLGFGLAFAWIAIGRLIGLARAKA